MSGRIAYPTPARRHVPADLRDELPARGRVEVVGDDTLAARLVARRFGDTDDARTVLDALGVTA